MKVVCRLKVLYGQGKIKFKFNFLTVLLASQVKDIIVVYNREYMHIHLKKKDFDDNVIDSTKNKKKLLHSMSLQYSSASTIISTFIFYFHDKLANAKLCNLTLTLTLLLQSN